MSVDPTNWNDSKSSSDLAKLQEMLGHAFEDLTLLEKSVDPQVLRSRSGRRLHTQRVSRVLGDSILGFLITDMICHRFPGLDEGHKTKIKAYLVSAVALSGLALNLDLAKYLRLGKGEEKRAGGKGKRSGRMRWRRS